MFPTLFFQITAFYSDIVAVNIKVDIVDVEIKITCWDDITFIQANIYACLCSTPSKKLPTANSNLFVPFKTTVEVA